MFPYHQTQTRCSGCFGPGCKLEEALKSYEVSFTLLPMVAKPAGKAPPTASQPASTRLQHFPTKGQKGAEPIPPIQQGSRNQRQNLTSGFQARSVQQVVRHQHQIGIQYAFDYSLKKCKETVTDARCRKEYHVCCMCYVSIA